MKRQFPNVTTASSWKFSCTFWQNKVLVDGKKTKNIKMDPSKWTWSNYASIFTLSEMPNGSVNRDFTLHCRHISRWRHFPLTCNLHQNTHIVRLSALVNGLLWLNPLTMCHPLITVRSIQYRPAFRPSTMDTSPSDHLKTLDVRNETAGWIWVFFVSSEGYTFNKKSSCYKLDCTCKNLKPLFSEANAFDFLASKWYGLSAQWCSIANQIKNPCNQLQFNFWSWNLFEWSSKQDAELQFKLKCKGSRN